MERRYVEDHQDELTNVNGVLRNGKLHGVLAVRGDRKDQTVYGVHTRNQLDRFPALTCLSSNIESASRSDHAQTAVEGVC